MFLVNGMKAKLRQFNRDEDNNVFDDQNYKEVFIKCCPYNVDESINFGIYTHPEATGYYQVPRWVDVKEGDQIIFLGNRGVIEERATYFEWLDTTNGTIEELREIKRKRANK